MNIENLKHTRINRKLKQAEAADILGVSQGEYSKIERGVRKKVSEFELKVLIDRMNKS